MKKKLCKCFMTGFMMLFMMFLVAVPAAAENGPATDLYAFIALGKEPSFNPAHIIFHGKHKPMNSGWEVGSPEGVSYDQSANTLTLNNVNMPDWGLSVNMMGDDFKLNITGKNSLNLIVVYGDHWGGNVEITGNGTLELNKNKSQVSAISMSAERTAGRLTIDSDVTVTAYKGSSKNVISITASTMSSAPVTIHGKLSAPLTLSENSGEIKEGYFAGCYEWYYTNDVISITPAAGGNTGSDSKPSTGTDSKPNTGTDSKPNTGTDSKPNTGGNTGTGSNNGSGSSKACIVTFDTNGGTMSTTSVSIESGKEIGALLPAAGRKNYTFKGWFTQKKGGTQVTSSTKVTQDITIHARWTKVSVKKASAPAVKKKGNGKMSVKIKKVSGAEGYQITYSTSSNFKSSKNIMTTSLKNTVSKLKKGKTYYVKVRAYKADSLNNEVYGKYSKTVKIKL